MNGVNLKNPELKLANTDLQSPAKALSSSRVQSANAADPASSINSPAALNRSQAADVGLAPEGAGKNKPVGRESLGAAVSQLNEFVQNVQRDLQFEVDNERGQTIVKVVDQRTQEVIRQIPDEVALRLAENLQQDEPLSLFNIEV